MYYQDYENFQKSQIPYLHPAAEVQRFGFLIFSFKLNLEVFNIYLKSAR